MSATLVTYATQHGATAGIAERIGARLRLHTGADAVDVLPVDAVTSVTPRYGAVVLGSGIYNGLWLPPATTFAEHHGEALAGRPLWLFSAAAFDDTHRLVGRIMPREPKDIGDLRQRLRPRGYRVFAGVVERGMWPPPAMLLYRAFGGRPGDHRDWAAIDRWADEIAESLGREP
jgi:menaquinone-dependent protoporphyrinogen oxidase